MFRLGLRLGFQGQGQGYITLHYITLHYITSHYITLHYITLTLHYITCTLHLHYIYINPLFVLLKYDPPTPVHIKNDRNVSRPKKHYIGINQWNQPKTHYLNNCASFCLLEAFKRFNFILTKIIIYQYHYTIFCYTHYTICFEQLSQQTIVSPGPFAFENGSDYHLPGSPGYHSTQNCRGFWQLLRSRDPKRLRKAKNIRNEIFDKKNKIQTTLQN